LRYKPEKHKTFCAVEEAYLRISVLASSSNEAFRATIETWAPIFIASIARHFPIPLEPPVI
jgi:hypothetical protein